MTRWFIEKSGTGIEKSGTGIEKSGTGIEKSGTGIEKSGTGIEKSGTGLRRALLSCAMAAITVSAYADDSNLAPEGLLQIVTNGDSVKVSWIFDNSVFSGIAVQYGSFANVLLTEVALYDDNMASLDTVGSGTGAKTVGSGTGADTVGSGTGADTVGSGTGADTVGSGTGSNASNISSRGNTIILTVGSGTGSEAIAITLPSDEGMQMEISLSCNAASVSILDANFGEVVTFENVTVVGASGFCSDNNRGFGSRNPPREIGDRR